MHATCDNDAAVPAEGASSSLLSVAWAAGFLDGEGHFGLMGAKHRRRPVIEAAQVGCPRALHLLRQTLGGRTRGRSHRTLHWRLEGRRAIKTAVPLLLPHLCVKQEQARLILKFAEVMRTRGSRGRPLRLTAIERQQRDRLESRLRSAKHAASTGGEPHVTPLPHVSSELTPEGIAWAAGFLDGEGYLGIGGRGQTPLIEASQRSTVVPLLRLQGMFRGSVGRRGRAPRWVWKLNSAPSARLALALLTPHLVVKAEQADALLGYACTFTGRGVNSLAPVATALRMDMADRLAAARKG